MTIFEAFFTDGNKLASIAGSTTAFSKPVYGCIPQYILFAIHDTLDVWLQIFIFVNGNCLFEGVNIKQFMKLVLSSKLGVLGGSNNVLQYFPLCVFRMIFPGFDTPKAHAGKR